MAVACGAKVCIKPNPTRKRKRRYHKTVDKCRNRIERFFGRLKRCRRIATRYEKKPTNNAGFLWLAALTVIVLGLGQTNSSGSSRIGGRFSRPECDR